MKLLPNFTFVTSKTRPVPPTDPVHEQTNVDNGKITVDQETNTAINIVVHHKLILPRRIASQFTVLAFITFILFVGIFMIFALLCYSFEGIALHLKNTGSMVQLSGENSDGSSSSHVASCSGNCWFSLLESIPQNLTYGPHQYVCNSTFSGIEKMLSMAKSHVDIASFYWTMRGDDTSFYDGSAIQGEVVFKSLAELKARNITLRIVQNSVNNDTGYLMTKGLAEVRTLDMTSLLGAGVLHTKFWIVDEQHFYVGSANMDWRSFTQVKELGLLVQSCPCLTADLQKIFDMYWYLSRPTGASVPNKWPKKYSTDFNSHHPLQVPINGTDVLVYISSSPAKFCPAGRMSDIDAILSVINEADRFINIAVMDYSPTTLYRRPNIYWPVIDDALRGAAYDRNVTVRLLVSNWTHTYRDMYKFLCSLQMIGHIHRPHTTIDVRLFEVPHYTANQSRIPFARVNHSKYMVTDRHAYIGTSNWSGDYFISTAGVGFVVKQPSVDYDTPGNVRRQLEELFSKKVQYQDELSEAFNMFCNTSDKMLELCELGRVLRSAGKAPSESQLQDLTSECEKKGHRKLSLKDVVAIAEKFDFKPASIESLRDALSIFDKDRNGMVNSSYFRNVLCNLGEKLNPELADEFIRQVDCTGVGYFQCDDFIKAIQQTL